jgi:cell division protein ZapB
MLAFLPAIPNHRAPPPAIVSTHTELQAELLRLEEKVDALLALCRHLQQDNEELQGKNRQLAEERSQLLEKAAIARNRVESMVARLRAVGQEGL